MNTLQTEHQYIELERLICAAVGNQHFAAQLLDDPEIALHAWERSHALSSEEHSIVTSIIDAIDIYDFAARLYALVMQPRKYKGSTYLEPVENSGVMYARE